MIIIKVLVLRQLTNCGVSGSLVAAVIPLLFLMQFYKTPVLTLQNLRINVVCFHIKKWWILHVT